MGFRRGSALAGDRLRLLAIAVCLSFMLDLRKRDAEREAWGDVVVDADGELPVGVSGSRFLTRASRSRGLRGVPSG